MEQRYLVVTFLKLPKTQVDSSESLMGTIPALEQDCPSTLDGCCNTQKKSTMSI
jgi:hypothetical protein